jgi:ribonuclease P protein component
MPAKEERLRKQKDFEKVFKNGKSAFSKTLGIKISNNNQSINRFGIIISTKISKKATERNKTRRHIRSIIDKLKPDIKTGHDLIFITLLGIKETTFKEKEITIISLLKKLKLLS